MIKVGYPPLLPPRSPLPIGTDTRTSASRGSLFGVISIASVSTKVLLEL